MLITIKKGASNTEIKKQMSKLSLIARGSRQNVPDKGRKEKKTIADYYGSLKGVFGDGLKYQKQIRNEWE